MSSSSAPVLSVVVPVYDEREVLPLFAARTRPVLDGLGVPYEVVAVDDGSTDGTPEVLAGLAAGWPQLRVLRLRRNAGHQAAITAGLDAAAGAYVVTLDADLQDPPELVPELLATAQRAGVDVVYAARDERGTDTWFKRTTARAYYRLMRRIAGVDLPPHAGDYRLMSRAVVGDLRALPERHKVYRLLVPWLGYPSATVHYAREARAAGRTHYPLAKMVRLGLDSVTAFSGSPLRIATWAGGGGSVVAFLLAVWAVVARLAGHVVPGWTSVLVAVLFLGAVQLLCVGLLGEYLGRLFSQSQGRPVYYLQDEAPGRAAARAAEPVGGGQPASE
ncbi:dolichol-phosphate mannosyltransferase [Motilibacter rhizosphaerae]|uniref:Dolichol-phosphate mannosyltransferase n=1 Tax=Motilibacter rhizosphaerae TaxID=598652 RepID=A0A4Q7NVK5_9ACTN|nr:glycosyltransferase family 2 protein [Motilibacter rhizosphaerae]RZS91296.1 dolichol-phosphate mannosyltransferase [Motilibacter rhizosphaerae]